jgi:hypothetical protein
MDTKVVKFPVATKVLETPALIERLDEEANAKVLVEKLGELMPIIRQFVRFAVARETAAMHKSGDVVLTLKEVAAILKRSPQSISIGWRKGRYPFMLKDGAHLVASEDGLQRWIKARTRST